MSNIYGKKVYRKKRYRKIKGRGLNRKQKTQIKKMIESRPEKKYYDTTWDDIQMGNTPTFTDITAPAQGTTTSDRIGSNITLENVSFSFRFSVGASNGTNYIRMVIFQWFPDNANDLPSWTQIFQYPPTGSPASQYEYMSPLVLDEGGVRNFKVLLNQEFNLDEIDDTKASEKGFINKGYKKTITFGDAIITGNNHIYVMFISDSIGVEYPHVSGFTRVRYIDC